MDNENDNDDGQRVARNCDGEEQTKSRMSWFRSVERLFLANKKGMMAGKGMFGPTKWFKLLSPLLWRHNSAKRNILWTSTPKVKNLRKL